MQRARSRTMDVHLFRNLVLRQVRQDYLENITGFTWLILQPVMLLAVYAFVFTQIFQARIPDLQDTSFVAYLAIAFWPWTAFAESVLKASNAITAHGALISKVAFAAEHLPLATVTATFTMHSIGYLAVLLILQFTGTAVQWTMLPLAVAVMALLYLFACGLALWLSALQVFVRDLAQLLPPLFTFWFFMTPILYSRSLLPEGMRWLADWNPMTWFVTQLRELLLWGEFAPAAADLVVPAAVLGITWLGLRFFQRLGGHFEDFL